MNTEVAQRYSVYMVLFKKIEKEVVLGKTIDFEDIKKVISNYEAFASSNGILEKSQSFGNGKKEDLEMYFNTQLQNYQKIM